MSNTENGHLSRREFLRMTGATALGAPALLASGPPAAGEGARRPNVLYIFTDQQFAGAMSCAGNRDLKTPAMDRLAREGTLFTQAYCAQPICSPSRAAMITGLTPHETGVVFNNLRIHEHLRQRELGWVFRNAGYECAYGGKWHLRNGARVEPGHGFDEVAPMRDTPLADACVQFLCREHTKPFLLVASFNNPHNICEWARGQKLPEGPIPEAPPERWPAPPPNLAIPPDEPEAIQWDRTTNGRVHPTAGWGEQKWREYRFAYYRLIEKVDAEIGRILEALRAQGLEENTLVVFSSDHGDGMGAHHWNQKSVLYEEATRVPFIVSWKGVTRPGVVDGTHLVSAGLDLFPTLCDYTGVNPPPGLRGRSVRPLADGRDPGRWRDDLAIETVWRLDGPQGRMLRTARYKYMVYSEMGNREQLVDLQEDPGEMVNLAGNPRCREVLADHRRRLAAWCKETDDSFAVPG